MSKVSPAQFAVLESCVRYGAATAHIKGMSAWGGWGSTREAMIRKGYIDDACRITDIGRAAYKQAGGTFTVSVDNETTPDPQGHNTKEKP